MWFITEPPRLSHDTAEYIPSGSISEQSAVIKQDLDQAAVYAEQTISSIEKRPSSIGKRPPR